MEKKMLYLIIAHTYLGAMLVITGYFYAAAFMWLIHFAIGVFFHLVEEKRKMLAPREQIENIINSKKSRGKHGQRK